MTDAQIKHMVDRFLGWRLPETFAPDAGISFEPNFNAGTSHPMKHEPIGTNLFTATEAEAMVRHMIEGMPEAAKESRWTAYTATSGYDYYPPYINIRAEAGKIRVLIRGSEENGSHGPEAVIFMDPEDAARLFQEALLLKVTP